MDVWGRPGMAGPPLPMPGQRRTVQVKLAVPAAPVVSVAVTVTVSVLLPPRRW